MLAALGKREAERGPVLPLAEEEKAQVRAQARRVALRAVLSGAAFTLIACGLVALLGRSG